MNGSATLTQSCYSLEQLCEDKTIKLAQLIWLLLPGKHVIPQGETLFASDTESFNLPWNGQQNVMIECQRKSNLNLNIG